MVDKNYKNDKLYTQTKIMYMRFITRKGRKRENRQINRYKGLGKRREIEIEGKKQEREEKAREINKRRK